MRRIVIPHTIRIQVAYLIFLLYIGTFGLGFKGYIGRDRSAISKHRQMIFCALTTVVTKRSCHSWQLSVTSTPKVRQTMTPLI